MVIWTPALIQLRDILAAAYPDRATALGVIVAVGLNPAYISPGDNSVQYWHNILQEAQLQGKTDEIIDHARARFPDLPWLKEARVEGLPPVEWPVIGEDVPWRGPDNPENLEKIIGAESTLVPITFLETGLERARSVARVVRADGALGSGFLIAGNLLITNNHVLPTAESARSSVAQFNYQQTQDGLATPFEEQRLAPDELFVTSHEHDWTVVRVIGAPCDRWGALDIQPANPTLKDRVNIIQHPGGEPKQLALYHNVIVYVGNHRVQYLTDTRNGSSGSPVFDQRWQLVALHHAGGALREPGTFKTFYRNEGIHINTVIEGLRAAGVYPH